MVRGELDRQEPPNRSAAFARARAASTSRLLVAPTALVLFSFLLWLYIVLRIVFNRVSVMAPFIDRVPSISYWVLGAFSFVVSSVCMFLYLWLWSGFGRSRTVLGRYEDWQP
jgi:hypothetical protein